MLIFQLDANTKMMICIQLQITSDKCSTKGQHMSECHSTETQTHQPTFKKQNLQSGSDRGFVSTHTRQKDKSSFP